MNKAREWAMWWSKVIHLATDPRGYRGDRPRPRWGIEREDRLAFVTDLGNLSLADMTLLREDALALARWILDTFDEPALDRAALVAEIKTDDALLADLDRILDALPCPVHGRCVPYVLKRITEMSKC